MRRLSIIAWALKLTTTCFIPEVRNIVNAMSIAWTPGVLNHRSKLAYDLGIVMTLEPDNI